MSDIIIKHNFLCLLSKCIYVFISRIHMNTYNENISPSFQNMQTEQRESGWEECYIDRRSHGHTGHIQRNEL